jgi:hypothetical protein
MQRNATHDHTMDTPTDDVPGAVLVRDATTGLAQVAASTWAQIAATIDRLQVAAADRALAARRLSFDVWLDEPHVTLVDSSPHNLSTLTKTSYIPPMVS